MDIGIRPGGPDAASLMLDDAVAWLTANGFEPVAEFRAGDRPGIPPAQRADQGLLPKPGTPPQPGK